MSVQNITNQFNKVYSKATISSHPQDYYRAALLGRQLINKLVEQGVVEDNWDNVYKDEFDTE